MLVVRRESFFGGEILEQAMRRPTKSLQAFIFLFNDSESTECWLGDRHSGIKLQILNKAADISTGTPFLFVCEKQTEKDAYKVWAVFKMGVIDEDGEFKSEELKAVWRESEREDLAMKVENPSIPQEFSDLRRTQCLLDGLDD